jgi:GDPmannose 4,6-dehydratase
MRALITGVCGQDGSYLADILLDKGYEVYGVYRHSSKDPFDNVRHNIGNPNFHLIQGDVTDALCLDEIIRKVDPHQIYHEADQDNVDWSFLHPAYQVDVTVKAVSNLLASVRRHCPSARVFIPCSSTMFGDAPAPQTEETPFNPRSPYACAKVAAYHLARMYRQNHGMFVCTGILYNHDSPRRNGNYLLHKICKAAATGVPVAMFDVGQDVTIGYAKDYMEHVYDLMQLSTPNDYVVCNAYTTSIRQLIRNTCFLVNVAPDTCFTVTESTMPYRSPSVYGSSRRLFDAIGPKAKLCIVSLLEMLIKKYRRNS